MAFNRIIVEQMNKALQTSILSQFEPAKYFGLAMPYPTKDAALRIPGVANTKGEIEYVNVDDSHNLQVYHRNVSNTYTETAAQFGDGTVINCTAENNLFVYAKGEVLNILADDLEGCFVLAFPRLIENINPELEYAEASLVSSNMQKLDLARQEFGSADKIKPEHHFFSIRYRITSSFDMQCLGDYLKCSKN